MAETSKPPCPHLEIRWWDAAQDETGRIEAGHYCVRCNESFVPAAAVREARAAVWDEARKAGEHYEREMWRYQSGALIPRPERPRNPYRADRIAVDASEGGEGR